MRSSQVARGGVPPGGDAPHTVGALIAAAVADHPDKVAIDFAGRRTRYRDLACHADRIARALASSGVAPGDRIAYLGRNSDTVFHLLFGAAAAGVMLVPLNWRLSPAELGGIIRDADPAIVFCESGFAPVLGHADLALSKTIVTVATDCDDAPEALATWLREAEGSAPNPHAPCAADIALLVYTSGTTGRPKGVMLSQGAIARQIARHVRPAQGPAAWRQDDVMLATMPVFHVGGIGPVLVTLHAGGTVAMLREFDVVEFIRAVGAMRVTATFLVPTALHTVLRHPTAAGVDFTSIRTLLYGASPMPLPLLREAIAAMRCGFVQAYGMTEMFGGVTELGPDDHDPAGSPVLASVGRVVEGAQVRIVDGDGAPVPDGIPGEIHVRSVFAMTGYWRRPEATIAAFTDDGWYRSGDVGILRCGYLHLRDRLDDMMISGGENIYPVEIESVMAAHPAVDEVVVIGVPDARWGEAVKAVVVRRAGRDDAAADILAWTRARIAGFKTPQTIDFVDSLPRSTTGKVLRRAVRDRYRA